MDTRRIVDVITASLVLIPASLAMLPAMAAVAVTMGGHPIFRQQRYGLNGKPFTMYKIRTMTNARGTDGYILPDEQRKTRLGNLLRRTAIDELPQLFNILKGDMSILGPRPMPYEPKVREWGKRYAVRPGLTGLAQVREKKSGHQALPGQQLKDDLEYIQTRSFRRDVRLLWSTMAVVATGRIEAQPHSSHNSLMRSVFMRHER